MIDAEKASYKISWMCRLLGVPGCRLCLAQPGPRPPPRRRELSVLVRTAFEAGRGTYGCRRVAAQLSRAGHSYSVGLVADLMRELGLRACQPQAYRRTTVRGVRSR